MNDLIDGLQKDFNGWVWIASIVLTVLLGALVVGALYGLALLTASR